jgi:hypothetical protein
MVHGHFRAFYANPTIEEVSKAIATGASVRSMPSSPHRESLAVSLSSDR